MKVRVSRISSISIKLMLILYLIIIVRIRLKHKGLRDRLSSRKEEIKSIVREMEVRISKLPILLYLQEIYSTM